MNKFRTLFLNVFTLRIFEILYYLRINITTVLNFKVIYVCFYHSVFSVYYFIYTALTVDKGTKIRKNIKQFNNNIVYTNICIILSLTPRDTVEVIYL